jgi:hypothetical protein
MTMGLPLGEREPVRPGRRQAATHALTYAQVKDRFDGRPITGRMW